MRFAMFLIFVALVLAVASCGNTSNASTIAVPAITHIGFRGQNNNGAGAYPDLLNKTAWRIAGKKGEFGYDSLRTWDRWGYGVFTTTAKVTGETPGVNAFPFLMENEFSFFDRGGIAFGWTNIPDGVWAWKFGTCTGINSWDGCEVTLMPEGFSLPEWATLRVERGPAEVKFFINGSLMADHKNLVPTMELPLALEIFSQAPVKDTCYLWSRGYDVVNQ